MPGNLRAEVLRIYKKLHRTRQEIFQQDEHALTVLRRKLYEEFKKNKNVTDESSIKELIKFANEVDHEFRTTVIQICEKRPGVFEARITEYTQMHDNIPYGQKVDKSLFKHVKCPSLPKK
ncbi:PREDICTED: complex III assembly factor LYRM7 [Ceratosolen solmsi marchali]|uniref:Complex III assembly factor LYRM7 n=1 Tax=Ceratosolen solmsi marchali TaxID=326594 RepID=A0AAJ7DWC8_9HYME|nr:PREDICTED: complex III assembly factor LYRM7 [Ceratosolen solmsi marchali]